MFFYYVQYMAEGKVKRGWLDSRAGAVTARSLSFPSTQKINQKYYIYNLATARNSISIRLDMKRRPANAIIPS